MIKKLITVISLSLLSLNIATATPTAAPSHKPNWARTQADMAKELIEKQAIVVSPLQQSASTEVYVDLIDHSKHMVEVIAATSPLADRVQLHKFVGHHGKMVQVPYIKIHADAQDDLKPGGYHIMLIDLEQQLQPGQKIPVTLIFKDGSHTTIDAVAK